MKYDHALRPSLIDLELSPDQNWANQSSFPVISKFGLRKSNISFDISLTEELYIIDLHVTVGEKKAVLDKENERKKKQEERSREKNEEGSPILVP